MSNNDRPSSDEVTPADSPGFLKRWSRQKSSAVATQPSESTISNDSLTAESDSADISDASGEAIDESNLPSGPETNLASDTDQELLLTDEDMPPIESLNKDSDMSGFLNKGVSDTLRKAAFRKLFSLPAFNIRDGLNDYDDDYTQFEPLGDTVTSDMKFHAARIERDRLAAEAEEAEQLRLEREELLETNESEPEQPQDEIIAGESEESGDALESEFTEDEAVEQGECPIDADHHEPLQLTDDSSDHCTVKPS
ncbi:MAG: DUF3306 domain-containing protein [Gammaproteobacteria bacterium]|nr:DUF3306 domain-containing protein [Gammaproteobacteria bacterium]